MLDHFNLPISDLEAGIAFYQPVLAQLNMPLLLKDGDAVGFGRNNWEFGIVEASGNIMTVHLAFVAESRAIVRQFYQAAIAAGGVDNGEPGVRAEYGATYYAAYILDPDGHNIEAVCRSGDDHDESILL